MSAHSHRIRDYTTPAPHTVAVTETLAHAEGALHDLGVHQLPVVEGGRVLGILTERDVDFARALGVDLAKTSVGIAMTEGPLVVGPDEPLSAVLRRMAEGRVPAALVQERGAIVGIFTATDALRLLAEALPSVGVLPVQSQAPSEVRRRILHEHQALRGELERVDAVAERALREEPVEAELFDRAQQLYDLLLQHLELEDRLLVPALRQTPGSGPRRADELRNKHHEQREQLQMGRMMLASGDSEHLAESLMLLSHWVRVDMQEEEGTLLSEALFQDSPVQGDASTG